MPHLCHAKGCQVAVPPARFMCWRHWHQVPEALRKQIWITYRRGQEIDKRPSASYLAAAAAAIEAVANA